MVDAPEGVIGIEWIEGQSIRMLLGADDDEEVQEADGMGDPQLSLTDFGLGESACLTLNSPRMKLIYSYRDRSGHVLDWERDREDAPCRCHP